MQCINRWFDCIFNYNWFTYSLCAHITHSHTHTTQNCNGAGHIVRFISSETTKNKTKQNKQRATASATTMRGLYSFTCISIIKVRHYYRNTCKLSQYWQIKLSIWRESERKGKNKQQRTLSISCVAKHFSVISLPRSAPLTFSAIHINQSDKIELNSRNSEFVFRMLWLELMQFPYFKCD